MSDGLERSLALAQLEKSLNGYYPLSEGTWSKMRDICRVRHLEKHGVLYQMGVVPTTFAVVYKGLFRAFASDAKGHQYNKTLFEEGQWPAAISALLKTEASLVTVEALESSVILEINFADYRRLLESHHDLALMQVHYLEHNWLLAKDAREIALVQEDAGQRYQQFLQDFPRLAKRLTQYHIASHLGITPTQLSRIRKNQ